MGRLLRTATLAETTKPLGWRRRRARGTSLVTHRGLPPIDPAAPRKPLFKRLLDDERPFYLPVALYWMLLGLRHRSLTLPTAANPGLEAGGLWGESKCQGLAQLGPEARRWHAPAAWLRLPQVRRSPGRDCDRALAAMRRAGVDFPILAKPDRGYQSMGIGLVADRRDLADYLARAPRGEAVLLQSYVPYDAEAGVFYLRRPGEERGRIFSLTLVYFPFVVGDGHATVAELIAAEPLYRRKRHLFFAGQPERLSEVPPDGRTVRLSLCSSSRLGPTYRDARHLVTDALVERFDAIARDIPEFYFGRFDVRFRSLERFLEGEDFTILEVNGAGAEALHIWDPGSSLFRAYGTLFRQYRLAFEIGSLNRSRGFRPMTLAALAQLRRRQERLRKSYRDPC